MGAFGRLLRLIVFGGMVAAHTICFASSLRVYDNYVENSSVTDPTVFLTFFPIECISFTINLALGVYAFIFSQAKHNGSEMMLSWWGLTMAFVSFGLADKWLNLDHSNMTSVETNAASWSIIAVCTSAAVTLLLIIFTDQRPFASDGDTNTNASAPKATA